MNILLMLNLSSKSCFSSCNYLRANDTSPLYDKNYFKKYMIKMSKNSIRELQKFNNTFI